LALMRACIRDAPLPVLTTLYVARVSRDARSQGLRRLVAKASGVVAATVVDSDRFGTAAAVTLLASATKAFRAGLTDPSLAGVFWEVGVDVRGRPHFWVATGAPGCRGLPRRRRL